MECDGPEFQLLSHPQEEKPFPEREREIAAGHLGLKGCPGTEREKALKERTCLPRTLATVPGANLAVQLRTCRGLGSSIVPTTLSAILG